MQGHIEGFVFEAYGTLFDSAGKTTKACESYFPGKGGMIAKIWYEKTLEYSWICSLLERKADFNDVISRALETSLKSSGLKWNPDEFNKILNSFQELEEFPDAHETLMELNRLNFPFKIVSDGSRNMLLHLLNKTKLCQIKEEAKEEMVISAEENGFFKPNKAVYQAALKKMSKISPDNLAYVTSSYWDVAGARAAGFKNVIYLHRPTAHMCFDVYDKELAPCCNIKSLCDLIPLAKKTELKSEAPQAGSCPQKTFSNPAEKQAVSSPDTSVPVHIFNRKTD